MIKQLLAAAAALVSMSGLAGELPPMTWVEYHACKYNEGQTPASVADFADSWNSWMDSEDRGDYSAAILNPLYRSPPTAVDMLWVGATSSNEFMAAGQSAWRGSIIRRAD